jgi:hypothetical protein
MLISAIENDDDDDDDDVAYNMESATLNSSSIVLSKFSFSLSNSAADTCIPDDSIFDKGVKPFITTLGFAPAPNNKDTTSVDAVRKLQHSIYSGTSPSLFAMLGLAPRLRSA